MGKLHREILRLRTAMAVCVPLIESQHAATGPTPTSSIVLRRAKRALDGLPTHSRHLPAVRSE